MNPQQEFASAPAIPQEANSVAISEGTGPTIETPHPRSALTGGSGHFVSAGRRERRCICNHDEHNHVFDGPDSICSVAGCKCNRFHLWQVSFYDPFGKRHEVHDIAKFVRDNPSLFDSGDTEVRPRGRSSLHRSQGWTRAEVGLDHLVQGLADSWKEWTICTYPKTYIEPK